MRRPRPSWSDLGAAEVQCQALGAVLQVPDVEGHQLGAAEGAHEPDQQQRPIPAPGQGVGRAGRHQPQHVGGQQRRLLVGGHALGAPDTGQHQAHRFVLGGGEQPGPAVGLGDAHGAAHHRRGLVGAGVVGQVEGDDFGAGGQGIETVRPHHALNARQSVA